MLSDRGHDNLWARTALEDDPFVPLASDINADVAIIGAGFTGLSTALHLAERGLKPVVVEAHGIGHGGSGRNVGLVNAGMWVKPNDLIETQGKEWGQRLISTLGDGPKLVFDLVDRFDIACEAERKGTLHLAVGDKGLADLRDREAQWRALGAPVRGRTGERLHRFPVAPRHRRQRARAARSLRALHHRQCGGGRGAYSALEVLGRHGRRHHAEDRPRRGDWRVFAGPSRSKTRG